MKILSEQTQTQRPLLSSYMQQGIEILLLPVMELNTLVNYELEQNPLLEVDENHAVSSEGDIQIDDLVTRNIDRLKQSNESEYSNDYSIADTDEDKTEFMISRPISLQDYLLRQLWFELSEPLHLRIGEFIIGNLDYAGYLKVSCAEIARILRLNGTEEVEKVLNIIHDNFDPPGIAARNLKECLIIQSKYKFNGKADLICRVIDGYLNELGSKNFDKIARKLKISPEQVKQIANDISMLNPKPANNYTDLPQNIFIMADITVLKNEIGEYEVIVNRGNVPYLKVSNIYKRMLKHKNITKQETQFIRDKLKRALLFIKSIEQRQHTLKQISEYIIKHQKSFFDNGYTEIKPMTLKDVAYSINRNESTISRAIHNKYMYTPHGLISIKTFFSQAISNKNQHANDTTHCSRSIKEQIKILIRDENKNTPLSDQDIVNYFKEHNIYIARRTVAKYRNNLNILPAYLRKR